MPTHEDQHSAYLDQSGAFRNQIWVDIVYAVKIIRGWTLSVPALGGKFSVYML